METGTIAAVARHMIKLFYEKDRFQKSQYYTKDMTLIVPRMQERTIRKIEHGKQSILFHSADTAFVSGSYQLQYTNGNDRMAQSFCHYSALFQMRKEKLYLLSLHISEEPGKVFRVTDVLEHTYYLSEADMLYLEAGHNRTLWHTNREIIEVAGNLSKTEQELSAHFVRIHKSFIVNSRHVSDIARCYAELSNGEMLQIPVKKYVAVKEKLMQAKESL